jgi:hypothetical protein
MMQKNQADSNAAQTFDRQRSATPANFKRAVAGSVVTPDRQVDLARHPVVPPSSSLPILRVKLCCKFIPSVH